MFERFTNQSRYAIVAAQEEARSLHDNHIGSEHLLLGLLRGDQSTAARVLAAAGVTLEAARHHVDPQAGQGEQPPPGHIPFTQSAKECLELSLREALNLGHRYIGSGHLLLGLISQRDPAATGILGPDLDQLGRECFRSWPTTRKTRTTSPVRRGRIPVACGRSRCGGTRRSRPCSTGSRSG